MQRAPIKTLFEFARLKAMPDGPAKKFYLIQKFRQLLPEGTQQLPCKNLVAIIEKELRK